MEDEEEDSDDEADDDFMVNREKVRLSILHFAKLVLKLVFPTFQNISDITCEISICPHTMSFA